MRCFLPLLLTGTLVTSAPAITFKAGQPETILSHERQQELGIAFIDTGLPMVNMRGQRKWFLTRHDYPNNDEGQVMLEGPLEDPFAKVVRKDIRIEGAPEERVEFNRPGNGCWIGNVYLDPHYNLILAFVHLEYWPHGMARKKYCRMGLAVSQDGGDTFQWCGYIITPDLPFERWLNHWYPEAPGTTNVGWVSYIIRDGYFYAYYRDTGDRPDQAIGGMACARAPVEEVVRAARDHKVTSWKKYYNGEFGEDGLGGKFTSLAEPRGLMHGDAAWNEYLGRYMLVVRDGKHSEDTGALLISFSQDGLDWSPWQDVLRDEHLHDYPVIISNGPDNEVTGKDFWIYYKYDPDDRMPEKYGTMRLDRVKVTLD